MQKATPITQDTVGVASRTLAETQASNARQATLSERTRISSEVNSHEALQATIDNFQRDQRPWVGVESATPREFMKWFNGRVQFVVDFKVHNYGRSVAQKRFILGRPRILSPSNRNEQARVAPYSVPNGDLGYDLLPTELLTLSDSMGLSAEEITEAVRIQHGDRNIFIEILGCVVYVEDNGGSRVVHHTPVSYALELTDKSYVTADTNRIANERMTLKQMPVYPGKAN